MQTKLEHILPPVPESLVAVIPHWTERYKAKEKYVMFDIPGICAPLTELLSRRSKLAPWIVRPGVSLLQ